MSTINGITTSTQIQEIIDAVTSKTKALFVSKSTYNAKISELESTISDLTARIEALEGSNIEEEPVNGDDPVDDNL